MSLSPSAGAVRAAVSLCLLLLAPNASATKFAGAFMADGGGARALGMGSAFVAVADDASATFWNPAGLVDLPSRQLLAMHSERFGDLVDRDFLSYVQPLRGERGSWRDGAFGVSVIHLAVDDIPFTDHIDLDLDGDGTVSDLEALELLNPLYFDQIRYETDRELALMFSYARRHGPWQFGGNVKVIRQGIGDYSSFGLGVDLGALRRDWWRRLDVGLKLQDATSTYLGWDTGRNETIAPVLVPGAAYDWDFERLRTQLTAAGAFEMHFDGRTNQVDQFGYQSWGGIFEDVTANLFLGIEATLSRRAHLRLGSHGGFDAKDLTYGVGLELGRLRIDYAHAGDTLDIDRSTHRVSLGVDF